MSIAVQEIPQADLSRSIPCEMLNPSPARCGCPAVARVHADCRCGNDGRIFVCRECLNDLASGNYACYICKLTQAVIREC